MKRFFILALLFISVLPLSFAKQPNYPYTFFGGEIFFINASSHDLFWEIDIIDGAAGGFYYNRLCLEKGDIVLRGHNFRVHNNQASSFDRNIADPNNYFTKIAIYEMETGNLLKKILPGDPMFVLKGGSIENNNAVYEALIDDSFLSGGQP